MGDTQFLNRALVESASHKCVIVLDRSPRFATPLPNPIPVQLKDESQKGQPPLHTGYLQRTWWDTSVESVLEHHRIVNDLFPHGSKLLRLVVSDFSGRFITPRWGDSLMSYEELLLELSSCDVPNAGGDASSCSILNGLTLAVDALSETSPLQQRAGKIGREEMRRWAREENGGRALPQGPWANSRAVGQQLDDYIHRAEMARGYSSMGGEQLHSAATTAASQREDGGSELSIADETATTTIPDANDVWRRLALRNRGTILVFTTIAEKEEGSRKKAGSASAVESEFESICDHVLEQITTRNESIRTVEQHEGLYYIDKIDLYVLNFNPSSSASTKRQPHQHTSTSNPTIITRTLPLLRAHLVEITDVEALLTPNIHRVLHEMYDLASTTVSGIPMKEEAQPGQSINYDVELFHPRAAHSDLAANQFFYRKSSAAGSATSSHDDGISLDEEAKPHGIYRTVRLKWCTVTAKSHSDKFPFPIGSFPLTPAAVNSRPSVCLTQFVLAGKCVMLEVSKEAMNAAAKALSQQAAAAVVAIGGNGAGGTVPTRAEDIISAAKEGPALGPNLTHQQKLISHFLAKDETTGQLVLQCVAMGKQASLPPVTSGDAPPHQGGWTLADLNLPAMRQLMKAASLVPIPRLPRTMLEQQPTANSGSTTAAASSSASSKEALEYQKEINCIRRLTAHLPPMISSDTPVYQLHDKFEPILSTISNWRFSEEDWLRCNQAIVSLRENVDLQAALKAQAAALAHSAHLPQQPLSDSFQQAAKELAQVMANNAHLSPSHDQLLRLLCEKHGLPVPKPSYIPYTGQLTCDSTGGTRKRWRLAQPATPTKKPRVRITLFDLYQRDYEKRLRSRDRKDFEGRIKWGDHAEAHLYPDLKLMPGASEAGVPTAGGGGGDRAGGRMGRGGPRGGGRRGHGAGRDDRGRGMGAK